MTKTRDVAITRSSVAAYVAAQKTRLVHAEIWPVHASLSQNVSFACDPKVSEEEYHSLLQTFLSKLPEERELADYDDSNSTMTFDGGYLHYAPCRAYYDAMPLPIECAQWRFLSVLPALV